MRPAGSTVGKTPLRRRDVLVLFAGATFISPARSSEMPVIGLLESAALAPMELIAFYEGLKIEGFVRGQTVAIEYRSAQGDYGRLAELAADLAGRRVSLIVATGLPAAFAAKAATSTIPVVFAVGSDPVGTGLIASLDRPGGNITGVTEMAGGRARRRLELLHALQPTARIFALLVNPDNPNAANTTTEAQAAARDMRVALQLLRADAESAFEDAFAALAQSKSAGLAIADDALFASRGAQLAVLAARHAVPAIFQGRPFTAAGGLASYGSNHSETYHQAGAYGGLLLKGANSADLPVYRSLKTEFIVNARAARALGIELPAALLNAADAVIE